MAPIISGKQCARIDQLVRQTEQEGEDVGPATWPAIIDARDHRRLVAAIVGRGPTRGTVARVSLLAGLLRCSICDASLITQRRTTGARVYVCPARSIGGCGGLSIVADPVDELVAAAVVARVDGPALADLLAADPDDTDPATEVAEVEHALVELAADLGAGRLSRAEWLAAREGYDSRLTELRGAVGATTDTAVLRTFAGTPGALLAAWPALTLDQRRAIVAAVVQSVPIHPATRRGPGFDLESVRSGYQLRRTIDGASSICTAALSDTAPPAFASASARSFASRTCQLWPHRPQVIECQSS